MSDDEKNSPQHVHALAVTATRATLLNPVFLTGPLQPETPVDLGQLTHGGEKVNYSAIDDARVRMARFLSSIPGLPPRLVDTLTRAQARTTIANLGRVDSALRGHANGRNTPEAVSSACLVLADELLFAQAALGSAKAAACCAAIALHWCHAALRSGSPAKVWLTLRAAFLYAGDATEEIDEAGYVPEPIPSRLSAHDQLAHLLVKQLLVASDALRAIEDEDAILRGGAGVWDEGPPLSEISDGLADIVWPDERKAAAPKAATLRVFPSAKHLPKTTQTATDRGDGPRAFMETVAERDLPLAPAPDPHALVEAGVARAPWMRELLETIAQDLVGAPYAWLRPTLLVGGPGSGKTSLARWLAEQLGLPFRLYSVNATFDGSFVGTNRQWGSARPSVVAQILQQMATGSAFICCDEIEKGTNDRRNGRFDEAILPFLERESSKRIFDPYVECPLDLSAVTYVATANDLDGVSGPLRDRFRIMRMPLPRRQDLPVVAATLVSEIRDERGLSQGWMPDLEPDELDLLSRHWKGGSIRPLRRLVETLLTGRDRSAPRH
ncbi:hypothetical protein ASG63_08540 [Methylobacterium sp. Leaf94]|uniref:AAA family ATPase n=1 Tax=Methylobacterium sp. Leaf94 TaxID=1736250 RepID=UPI0006FF6790|nr:AAA family ATPase [Methylobacterium sp. Leaf94]KQU17549.1 hypothetical protein ASG63_08540 [Methylobacterium sp. Leaf94]